MQKSVLHHVVDAGNENSTPIQLHLDLISDQKCNFLSKPMFSCILLSFVSTVLFSTLY